MPALRGARQLDQLGVNRVDVWSGPRRSARPPRAGPSGARPAPRGRAGRARDAPDHAWSAMLLQLVDDEARHDQRAEQEAGGDDVGDSAVDERAGVDVGHRPAHVRFAQAVARADGSMPASRSASARSARLATVRPIIPRPVTTHRADGQDPAVGLGQVGHRQAQQESDHEADDQASDAADEFARRQLADAPDQPARRHERDVRAGSKSRSRTRRPIQPASSTSAGEAAASRLADAERRRSRAIATSAPSAPPNSRTKVLTLTSSPTGMRTRLVRSDAALARPSAAPSASRSVATRTISMPRTFSVGSPRVLLARDDGPREAQPRGLAQAALQAVNRPQLAGQADLAAQHRSRRRAAGRAAPRPAPAPAAGRSPAPRRSGRRRCSRRRRGWQGSCPHDGREPR